MLGHHASFPCMIALVQPLAPLALLSSPSTMPQTPNLAANPSASSRYCYCRLPRGVPSPSMNLDQDGRFVFTNHKVQGKGALMAVLTDSASCSFCTEDDGPCFARYVAEQVDQASSCRDLFLSIQVMSSFSRDQAFVPFTRSLVVRAHDNDCQSVTAHEQGMKATSEP
ncbi:uncharacterized protein LOC120657454 isoform X2 [Panicum virgatum]|uniref:uncharacterized protein LOC120657454 isoform X2 n=1 Tax=Panicum virgatum TaxID=38727 RepID=UPI0019D57A1C|nr:uncharacterized protein LOC120657454 isoform X2 [Panicum virgatum]